MGLSSLRRPVVLLALAALQIPIAPLAAQTDAGWLTERMDAWYHRAQRSAPGDWGIAIADQGGQVLWSVDPDAALMHDRAAASRTTSVPEQHYLAKQVSRITSSQ